MAIPPKLSSPVSTNSGTSSITTTPTSTTPRPRSGSSASDDSESLASLTSFSSTISTHQHTTTKPDRCDAPTKPSRRRRRNRSRKSGGNSISPRKPILLDLTKEEQAQYVAMDCEMVGVGALGTKSALARVVLVNWHGNVLLDRIIRPEQTVTDYRTFVSGITEADLAHAGDLESCRQEVKNLLRDRVLVGHGLKNDLAALSLRHPWQQTRDTAKYEPFMKIRFEDGVLWPRKLKDLCADKLRKTIQEPGIPHSPYEDAMAALHLYKRVRDKWEKAMSYKIAKTSEILGTNFGAVASQ